MKRNIALLIWLISFGLVSQEQTATLKIGDLIDPISDTILVPVICEEIEPISGNNEVNIQWFIRYSQNFINAGEPGGTATLLNVNSTLVEGCITSEIFDNTPYGSYRTIAFTCTCPTCGEIFPGEKFFDIQFTDYGSGPESFHIEWAPMGSDDTEMYDDEGNEYYLTLKHGYVGPQPPTATLKIGTIYNPVPGTVLVPITCEAINPIINNNLVSGFGWFVAYDANVLGDEVNFVNLNPQFPLANYLFNVVQDVPAPGWNTIAIIYACACSGEVYPGFKFFDIQFDYTEGASEYPNIKWTSLDYFQTNLADDEGNEFLLTLEDGYVGPASNDVTFHVTSNGNDLEGAWVTVGPLTLPTNASGIAVFSLQDGDYTYTVTKDGYAEEEGSFTIAGEPQLIEVEMEVCWDVTIHVVSGGVGLTGCTITIGDLVFNNDTTSSVCLPEGSYPLTVTKEGYYPYNGSITVNSSPQIKTIILIPMSYPVTFFVNCCGEPLEGIMLTVGSVTVITGADGMAAFNLPAGDYTVEIGGFIFTFSVPETSYMDADICSEVTFHVSDEQGYPLDEVNININGGNLVTDYTGEVDTCLQLGNYTYVAFKTGYVTQTSIIEVDTLPQIIEIVMPVISYGVTFHIIGLQCNNEFEGLVIIIDGETILPGEAIYLENGTYNFSLVLIGCGVLYNGMFTVNNSPVVHNLILPPLPKVTIHVTSTQGSNIQGAEVVVEEDTLYTNSSGEATFCMTGGDHYYSVAKENYDTINGIFNFPCENITIEVLMDPVVINNIDSSDFRLYPNPSDGKFYLEIQNYSGHPIELQIMDLTGRIVYERKQTMPETIEIDLSNQQNGMYFLRIKTEEENYTQKLIIQ